MSNTTKNRKSDRRRNNGGGAKQVKARLMPRPEKKEAPKIIMRTPQTNGGAGAATMPSPARARINGESSVPGRTEVMDMLNTSRTTIAQAPTLQRAPADGAEKPGFTPSANSSGVLMRFDYEAVATGPVTAVNASGEKMGDLPAGAKFLFRGVKEIKGKMYADVIILQTSALNDTKSKPQKELLSKYAFVPANMLKRLTKKDYADPNAMRGSTFDRQYEHFLKQGIQIIYSAANFGGVMEQEKFGKRAGLYNYDLRYWKVVTVQKQQVLQKKKGITPAAAIDELFANAGKWAFDCADITQVARWYAKRHTMGFDRFNYYIGPNISAQFFRLKAHRATGLASDHQYTRRNPKSIFNHYSYKHAANTQYEKHSFTPSYVLGQAQIGSRVMWRIHDSRIPEDFSFKNENTLMYHKDKDPKKNLYAAHPYGVITEAQIIDRLHARANKYIKNSEKVKNKTPIKKEDIFLAEVEIYENRYATDRRNDLFRE